MPLLLIPTDQMHLFGDYPRAYARCGWDVAVGARNFFLRSLRADLVHYQLPEELSQYKPPSPRRLDEIRVAVDWWASRCPTVISVHNLYPHGFHHDPAMHELYSIFYGSATVIVHSSRISHDLVLKEFPTARGRRHVVVPKGNYDRLLPRQLDRAAWRRHFGYTDHDFVVLVFGTLRFWSELRLIQAGYGKARVSGKRLLMAGRYAREGTRWPPPQSGLRDLWRELRWSLWLRTHGARPMKRFIPDDEVHRYLEAADVLLVPRLVDLASGLPRLALTFSRTVIAPNHGANPEWLAGTENPIYESGQPASLARAIERAAALDRRHVEMENRRLADRWTWDQVVRTCLEALEDEQSSPHGARLSTGSESPPR